MQVSLEPDTLELPLKYKTLISTSALQRNKKKSQLHMEAWMCICVTECENKKSIQLYNICFISFSDITVYHTCSLSDVKNYQGRVNIFSFHNNIWTLSQLSKYSLRSLKIKRSWRVFTQRDTEKISELMKGAEVVFLLIFTSLNAESPAFLFEQCLSLQKSAMRLPG